MPQHVEVHFKGNRKAYYQWPEPEPLRLSLSDAVERAAPGDPVNLQTGAHVEFKQQEIAQLQPLTEGMKRRI